MGRQCREALQEKSDEIAREQASEKADAVARVAAAAAYDEVYRKAFKEAYPACLCPGCGDSKKANAQHRRR